VVANLGPNRSAASFVAAVTPLTLAGAAAADLWSDCALREVCDDENRLCLAALGALIGSAASAQAAAPAAALLITLKPPGQRRNRPPWCAIGIPA
jgi:hypothetical protein